MFLLASEGFVGLRGSIPDQRDFAVSTWDLEFTVQGLGLRVEGLGFRVQGLGFGVGNSANTQVNDLG